MRRAAALIGLASLVLTGCPPRDGPDAGSGDSASAREGTDLVVSAASSLTEAFTAIGHAFDRANPGVTVTFNFGPSDGLAAQIDEGAPVDVFASASPTWMDAVEDDGPGVTGRADFARNRLAILVPADNPARIEDLHDLTEDRVQVVLAAEGVPAGDYARQVLENAGISDAALANVVSNEENVRGVIGKVAAGEADAGVVYATDVTDAVAGKLRVVAFAGAEDIVPTYELAALKDSKQPAHAAAFVDAVAGPPGAAALQRRGFLPP